MTVEVAAQISSTHVAEQVDDDEPQVKTMEKCSSYKEESNFLSDLKEHEKKALLDLKAKLEEAILSNNLLKKDAKLEEEIQKPSSDDNDPKEEEPTKEKEEEIQKPSSDENEPKEEEPTKEKEEEEEPTKENGVEEKDISIWGVPLLPSKGSEGTDVVLLKFLRAREFKVNEAFEMLKRTLQWRKEMRIDGSILEEGELGADLESAAYMSGVDRQGHPICYNIYGVFSNQDLYQKTFGSEEKRGQFLRWRFQLMERGIQKLDFKAGGVNSLLQINDLKNSPGLMKKDLRIATKQAVSLLQDNYPEFVSRNIIVNVPYWYYAFHALLSPFLTQRTKSKFVVAHPSKVNETLLKYIPIEEIPIQYGGFKRDNDVDFTPEDGLVSELVIKSGSSETIEIPMPEGGTRLVWDVTVVGWEVNYKEEFVPSDEGSYTIIVHKEKKIGSAVGAPIRNTFTNNEPGKIVISIANTSTKKKKKALYRYKTNKTQTLP